MVVGREALTSLKKGSCLPLTHKDAYGTLLLCPGQYGYNADAWYHLMNRGRRGEEAFSEMKI